MRSEEKKKTSGLQNSSSRVPESERASAGMHTEVDSVLTDMKSGGSPVPTGKNVRSDTTGGSLGEF